MTIDKVNNGEQRYISPRRVRARCFHFYDHSKNNKIPSILKRNRMRFTTTKSHPLKQITSKVNIIDDRSVYSQSQSDSQSQSRSRSQSDLSSSVSPSCYSPSEKILKIVMPSGIHYDDDNDYAVPSSFSPPSNKILKKKANVDYYRELSNTNSSPRNSVRFHSKVLVMRIPSRKQYPESMKRNMWCSLSEIARSAQRNTIEFSSEGWDWRSAVEEHSMYIHPKTGQYIHPVHVQRVASSASTSTSASSTTTTDVDKHKVTTMAKEEAETNDNNNIEPFSTHAQPAHE